MKNLSGHKKFREGGRLRIVFLLPSLCQNKDDRKCIKIFNASIIGSNVQCGNNVSWLPTAAQSVEL